MVNYGIQMYSLRDITPEHFEDAIKMVAEMGYKYVEYAGFFGHSAEEVSKWQKQYGVICSGTHTGWQELLPEKIEETIRFHKIIGCDNIIVPGADLSTLEKIKEFVDVMNWAQKQLAKEGITLGYHNHSGEFVLQPWGSTIHSELELRGTFDFEIDTFWAFNAGVDPVQIMDRLKNRIRVIHLKDGFRGGEGKSVGEGEAPVLAVVEKAVEMGVKIVIESESLTPSGPEEVGRCIEFLKKQPISQSEEKLRQISDEELDRVAGGMNSIMCPLGYIRRGGKCVRSNDTLIDGKLTRL